MLCYGLKLQSSSDEDSIVYSFTELYGSVWTWQWGIALPPLLLTFQQQARKVQAVAFIAPVSCCNSVVELPFFFSPRGTNVFILLSVFICGESCKDCLSHFYVRQFHLSLWSCSLYELQPVPWYSALGQGFLVVCCTIMKLCWHFTMMNWIAYVTLWPERQVY